MQEIIEQILNGNFDNESGSLEFSCTEINISIQKGECYEGEFLITAPNGELTTGHVSTSDIRMQCMTEDINGSHNRIAFCFHGENLDTGEVIKGFFYIISNRGEYYIPFVVSVEYEVLESSEYPIKNLFHFANLAKTDWNEAVSLFYAKEFEGVFKGNDEQYLECYRGLSAYKGQEQNVEEFLIQINKKTKIEYMVDQPSIDLSVTTADFMNGTMATEIRFTRNGWGYTALNIECDGDFLFAEKGFLSEDDFLGNHCNLPIYFDGTCCREGKNYGRIVAYNSYVCITIPVCVTVGATGLGKKSADKKKLTISLMEKYRDFRMKRINTDTWMKDTGNLVEQMILLDEEDIAAKLFKAQILITEERYNEAEWLLDQSREMMDEIAADNDEYYCYYLYLTTLIQRDEEYVTEIAEEVEKIYLRNRHSWRMAWLLLYLSEDYNKTLPEKWSFLRQQFLYGCNSLVIFIEALNLLNNNPSLLRNIEEFEIQILYYGAKEQFINPDLRSQVIYQCRRCKDYDPVLCKMLILLYEQKADTDLLEEICTMLIRGGKIGKSYFKWYLEGVDKQLRITNLYEYFMRSLDLNVPCKLPKTVLLYFSYQNSLDYERMAYLYHYVYENRLQVGDLYEQHYRVNIERFVMDQILKGHINRYLSELYSHFLVPEMLDEKMADSLSRLLFAHIVKVEDSRIHKVFVYQKNILAPREYSLFDGKACVPIYGSDSTLIFEDGYGNRFVKSVEYTMEKLMISGRFLWALQNYTIDCSEFNLYAFISEKEKELSQNNVQRVAELAKDENVAATVRRFLDFKLMQYYYDTDDYMALDESLANILVEEYDKNDRATIFKYMILRGQYELVSQWMEYYSPSAVEIGSLVRLVSALVPMHQEEENAGLLQAAIYVFKHGKYNNAVLEYLCRYYNGLSKDLRDIWKTAMDFGVDCYYLAERLLVQILYSGAFVGEKMDLFRYYVSQGAKEEIELAFITQNAFEYFAKEKITDSFLFKHMVDLYRGGVQLHQVCKLAFLQYYAENQSEMTWKEEEITVDWIREMMQERIHMSFFREFKFCDKYTTELNDKSIVEYRAGYGARAKIHYVIINDNGEAQDYQSEYMKEIFGGVFVREFVLFFGESLQYYIVEECNGEEQLTVSGTLQKNDIGTDEQNTRYELINDMVISKTLQDYDTLDAAIETYYRRDYYNRMLFEMK